MLILFSLIPIIITGSSAYLMAKKVLFEKLETTSAQTTEEISRGLDNYFRGMTNVLEILANDINLQDADNEIYFDFAKGLISNVKATDESIINVFVGTERGMFYTEPYSKLPEGFNHKTRDWYTDATQNTDEVIVTEPYIDSASGNLVVTLASAIQKNGTLVGVVGIDIDLAALSNSLNDIKVGDSGYLFIATKKGTIITHPETALIGTDTVTTLPFWSEAKNNTKGFTSYEFEGEDRFASYTTSDITGWKVIGTMKYSELSDDTRSISLNIQIVLLLTGIAAVIVSILFTRPISKNIKTLLTAFDHVSKGDLTTRVSIKSKDEFQVLGQHFNKMSDNISMLIHNVNEASNTVLDTSITLSNMAEETSVSLREVAKAVEEVSKGSMEQAQSAVEGALSMNELSDKMSLIDESAITMDGLSTNANDLTLQGLKRAQHLIENSNKTMESTLTVSELVYETKESMKQIDAISNTIDEITAQTNLLALNASIEAARAGESGKGFAVVAGEIRNLAEQSKVSTVKIKEIVADISTKTALSVKAMEETNENMTEQLSIVNETRSFFTKIMEAMDDLTHKVSGIKDSTQEIVVKKDNAVSKIEDISSISQETASATEEVTASTEQITLTMEEIAGQALNLQELSQKLSDKINEFKI
jgi:methyl-accepting chemotaxis protein